MPGAEPLLNAIGWCWAAFILFWLLNAFSVKKQAERQSRASRLGYLAFMFAGFWLFSAGLRAPDSPLGFAVLPQTFATVAIGLALTVTGLSLALWARSVLGSNWSASITFKEGHELVQRGPYAAV